MENKDQFVVKFDYNKEFLQKTVKEVETLDLSDLELVKETYKKFVKIRTTIKKQEKEMVDGANELKKKVFDLRNEYLEITEPVEEKLKSILDKEEERLILEVRKELLPTKKKQLAIFKIIQPSDDEILALDDAQWLDFFNSKFAEHTQNIEKEENEKKHKQEIKEAEERATKEAEDRAEQKEKDRIAQELKDKKKKEEEEKIEKARLESNKKYNKWLADNGWTKEKENDFIIDKSDGKIRLSKIIGIYVIK